MQQTQMVCPHCGSTLTFGVDVPAGTQVTCLICSQGFAAANPVAVPVNVASGAAAAKPHPGVTAAKPKPKPSRLAVAKPSASTIRKAEKTDAGRNPVMLVFTVVLLCLLTGGIAFGVWKITASARMSDSDTQVADNAKKDDSKKDDDGKKKEAVNPPNDPEKNIGTLAGQDPPKQSPPKLTLQQKDDIVPKLPEEVASAGQLKRKNPPKAKDSDPDPPPAIDVKDPQKKTEPPPQAIGFSQERINAAIEKGVKLLKQGQGSNGSWPGEHGVGLAALGGLTLVECGVPATDPAVRNAADFVRSNVTNLVATYDLSASILFLDRLGNPGDRAAIQTMALRLIAGQNEFGGWTYKSRMLTPPEMYQLHCFLRSRLPINALGGIPLDAAIEKQALGAKAVVPNDPPIARLDNDKGPIAPEKINSSLRFLSIVKNPSIEKGKIQQNFNGEGDNSNTQFALLALWAARRHGIPSDAPIMASYRRFVASQNTDGGWGYFMGGGSSNTMTNVGLLGLALGHGVAPDVIGPNPKDPKKQLTRPALQDRAIQRGLAYLARYIGQPVPNPTRAKFKTENMYFLWSVERVGVLYDLKTIGGKDWYGWGAQNLVSNQTQIGAWISDRYPGCESAHVNVCLALLFLRRSNLVHDLTNNLRFYSGIRDPG